MVPVVYCTINNIPKADQTGVGDNFCSGTWYAYVPVFIQSVPRVWTSGQRSAACWHEIFYDLPGTECYLYVRLNRQVLVYSCPRRRRALSPFGALHVTRATSDTWYIPVYLVPGILLTVLIPVLPVYLVPGTNYLVYDTCTYDTRYLVGIRFSNK